MRCRPARPIREKEKSRETRSRRPDRYTRRIPNESSETSFDERDFENLLMLNRAVTEVTVFTEQFPVVGGDGDISVLRQQVDRKSTRLNSSHLGISYAVFCLKKK